MATKDYFTLLKKAQEGDHEAQFHVGHQITVNKLKDKRLN